MKANSAIRVLVVDDHPIVREGIVAIVASAPDLEVVGQAANGAEAITQFAALRPDIVLMDLRMPVMDGVSATAHIHAEHPEVTVVVLTTYETDEDILSAIEAGATGYLLKAAPKEELIAGVRAAANGQVALAPSVAAALVSRVQAPEPARLTPREIEVLGLVADGLSNAQIGRRLFITEATVKTHLLRLFEKLGVNDRTRAVTLAMERGILPRDSRRNS
ncbi:response regulator transcription factor [Brooklawnia cerclae]|uniref:DNA-binding NarL/FixJ family response regulator n=1 Tax=Brooklawnia cerclae TaxID=349934 RepID=A0ABX0SHE7_9ACTN|nr:DNA-binding NarL/FixJ family response regulator [Brooklawnia cerclae]